MLYALIKIVLKLFGPNSAHDCAIALLRAIKYIPFVGSLIGNRSLGRHHSLQREVMGITFSNPVGLASGFDRNAETFSSLSNVGFGFVEVGPVTPLPQMGGRSRSSLTLDFENLTISNSAGYISKGLNNVVANLRRKRPNQIVGCNIGKNSITPESQAWQDYLRVFRNLYQYADFFTVNVWDVVDNEHSVLRTKEQILAILQPMFEFRLGQNQYRPILMKISPDLSDEEVDRMTDIMLDTPLDGIVATGPSYHFAGNKTGRKKVCGRPLLERTIQIVSRINERSHSSYPIIGCGGMISSEDVRRMLDAGASLVELHTGFVMRGPSLVTESLKALVKI